MLHDVYQIQALLSCCPTVVLDCNAQGKQGKHPDCEVGNA